MRGGLLTAFVPRLRAREPDPPGWWQISTRDPDTGLLNARALDAVGVAMARAASRRSEPLSVVVAHPATPSPADGAARAVRACFRGDEVLGRQGERIVVVLPDADEGAAVRACGDLDAALRAESLASRWVVGFATRPPEGSDTLADLIAVARRAAEVSV
jgi:GGDEF domain-containing protein